LSLENTLYVAVLADAGLSAIIGTRFYPIQFPQNPTLPAAVYQRISTVPYYTHAANLTSDQGSSAWIRIQITAKFQTQAGSPSISGMSQALSFYDAFRVFLGSFGVATGSPATVKQAPNFLQGGGFNYTLEPGTNQPIVVATFDFKTFYQE
jgi:hypothetical protein